MFMRKLSHQKELAIKLRLKGMSYSQIKSKIKVSKSSLSIWLEKYPLSKERIKELRDWNPRRIESSRNTKLKKRIEMLKNVYRDMADEIGKLSERDLFIAGLFLYWGEGTKSARDIVAFTNTDPGMIRIFIKWLELMGVKKDQLKLKLHLYSDMDIKKESDYWSKILNISKDNFRKPYIKKSGSSSLSYKGLFGHGTCTVVYGNSVLHNKIIMSLKYLREVVPIK